MQNAAAKSIRRISCQRNTTQGSWGSKLEKQAREASEIFSYSQDQNVQTLCLCFLSLLIYPTVLSSWLFDIAIVSSFTTSASNKCMQCTVYLYPNPVNPPLFFSATATLFKILFYTWVKLSNDLNADSMLWCFYDVSMMFERCYPIMSLIMNCQVLLVSTVCLSCHTHF